MAETKKKSLLRTKSFWGGVASLAGGIGLLVAGDIPGAINAFGIGIAAICLRDAITKVNVE